MACTAPTFADANQPCKPALETDSSGIQIREREGAWLMLIYLIGFLEPRTASAGSLPQAGDSCRLPHAWLFVWGLMSHDWRICTTINLQKPPKYKWFCVKWCSDPGWPVAGSYSWILIMFDRRTPGFLGQDYNGSLCLHASFWTTSTMVKMPLYYIFIGSKKIIYLKDLCSKNFLHGGLLDSQRFLTD